MWVNTKHVREVDKSGVLYLWSYFYGRFKNYGIRMHAVSIFMQIQKLWQIVIVFIACAQILDDIFVSTARMQKNIWWHYPNIA
jgi:hypothetical protein